MGKLLYIDCFSGISGDMMAGALLDLGVEGLDIDFLKKELKKINIEGYKIELVKEKRGAIYPGRLDVSVKVGQPFRNFNDIKILINKSNLKENVKKTGIAIFTEIAEAESLVHAKPTSQVHFHEVGAVDSIVDIMSTSIAVDFLNPEKIFCSKIPLGRGTADTMHGKIPIPAPATVHIVKGLPVWGGDFDFEVTTPTGAAIVKVLVSRFCDMPEMEIICSGSGAGTHEAENKSAPPNILRLFFGNTINNSKKPANFNSVQNELFEYAKSRGYQSADNLVLFSANIDDMTGEMFGHAIGRLFSLKALDVWTEPIYMKKNRPAAKLCVLCMPQQAKKILEEIFKETTTFGVRVYAVNRISLKRSFKKVKLPYGEVIVKTAMLDNNKITYSPEYESCAGLAEKTGKPLREIYRDLMFFLSSR